MSDRFTVLIADFLDETSIESAILDDIARIVMARARDETELAEYLPQADAILLFHDISIVGEPSFSRAPRCRCVVRAGVGYNNVDVEAATRHGVIVCNVPITAPRKSPTMRSCSCWRSCAGWCRRTRRSGREPGIIGPRWAPPACAARRSAWSAAAGSGRRRPCEPRRWGSTSSFTTPTCARGWTRRWASAAFISLKTCSSRAILSASTVISMRRAGT